MSDEQNFDDKKKNYEVGYKKPPKEHQFKKGEPSRNPQGRRKGSKNLPNIFRDILEEEITVTEGGKQKTMIVLEALVRRVYSDALKGKDKAIERVFAYAPKNEGEEVRYTMAELAEQMHWDKLKDDEIDIVVRFLGLEKEAEEYQKKLDAFFGIKPSK